MNNRIEDLKYLINKAKEEVSALKPNGRYFEHWFFEFNSTIDESILKLLESKYNINLPNEYRDYVIHIANGGNQPSCGMFSVQQSLAILNNEPATVEVLSNSNLSSNYCVEFPYNETSLNDVISKDLTLDDYFDYENKTFKYQKLLEDGDEESFNQYESEMKRHLLIFSYTDDMQHVEYAIALDGRYKGTVIYYSNEYLTNIRITNLNFIDWMIEFYSHALECKRGFFTSIEE